MSGWIGVDLDGTLAHYSGWVDELHIGDPVPVMLERVKRWRSEGKEVRIFTARVQGRIDPETGSPFDMSHVVAVIQVWCIYHLGEVLPVTNVKDFGMVQLWDDRCVQIIPNTGQRADGKE